MPGGLSKVTFSTLSCRTFLSRKAGFLRERLSEKEGAFEWFTGMGLACATFVQPFLLNLPGKRANHTNEPAIGFIAVTEQSPRRGTIQKKQTRRAEAGP
jgi:hypothetical protein